MTKGQSLSGNLGGSAFLHLAALPSFRCFSGPSPSSALCPRRFQGNAGSARPAPDAAGPDVRAAAPLPPYPRDTLLLPALAPRSQIPAQKIEPHRMSINEGRNYRAAHFLPPWRMRLCGRAVAGSRQLRESEGKFIPFCWYLMCFGCCRI